MNLRSFFLIILGCMSVGVFASRPIRSYGADELHDLSRYFQFLLPKRPSTPRSIRSYSSASPSSCVPSSPMISSSRSPVAGCASPTPFALDEVVIMFTPAQERARFILKCLRFALKALEESSDFDDVCSELDCSSRTRRASQKSIQYVVAASARSRQVTSQLSDLLLQAEAGGWSVEDELEAVFAFSDGRE